MERKDAVRLREPKKKATTNADSFSSSETASQLGAAWDAASADQRRDFLNKLGCADLCEAMSVAMRAELQRRVAGHQRAAMSTLDEVVSKAIRQALSVQKMAKAKNIPAPGVAAALNAVNNKLEAGGFDLNNVAIVVDPAMTQKQAA